MINEIILNSLKLQINSFRLDREYLILSIIHRGSRTNLFQLNFIFAATVWLESQRLFGHLELPTTNPAFYNLTDNHWLNPIGRAMNTLINWILVSFQFNPPDLMDLASICHLSFTCTKLTTLKCFS